MHKAHAIIIAVALGVAAVAGTFAALQTTSVGAQAAPSSSAAEIAKRDAKLDQAEKNLTRAAKRRPPALPPLPAGGSGIAAAAAPASGGALAVAPHDFDDDRDDWDDDDDHDDDHDDDDRDDDHDDDHEADD
jgi:hypothetical protein